MTLRETLERAHCCDELLAFAASGDFGGTEFKNWRAFWYAIERHDWLFWLCRHCPWKFEDSWADALSAAHGLADAYHDRAQPAAPGGMFAGTPEVLAALRAREACRIVREYIRLRHA